MLICLLMSLINSPTMANKTPKANDKQPPKIKQRVKKGAKFVPPSDGYFMSDKYAADLIANHQAQIKKLKAEIAHLLGKAEVDVTNEKLKCDAKLMTMNTKLAACTTTKDTQKSVYEKAITRVAQQASPPWYKSPYFNFIAGVAVCGGAIGIGKAVQ